MTSLLLAAMMSSAFAGTTRAEEAQNERELAQDYANIQDDTSDLRKLDAIISQWDSARRRRATGAELTADRALESWIRAELSESQRELTQARGEIRVSQDELRRERSRDDANDLRDDQSDLDDMASDLRRLQTISSNLNALQPAFDRNRAGSREYQAKQELLSSLRNVAERELRRDHAELSEDLSESREARRD